MYPVMTLVRLAMGAAASAPDEMSVPVAGIDMADSPADGHGMDGAAPGMVTAASRSEENEAVGTDLVACTRKETDKARTASTAKSHGARRRRRRRCRGMPVVPPKAASDTTTSGLAAGPGFCRSSDSGAKGGRSVMPMMVTCRLDGSGTGSARSSGSPPGGDG